MLRPTDSLLGSSRAARRANLRQERSRAIVRLARALWGIVDELRGIAWDTLVLVGMPLVYLAASYFTLDLPARWLTGREHFSAIGAVTLLGSVLVGLFGLARVLQQAPPLQPVSPRFARRAMLAGWAFAVLLTVSDLAG